jgi:hypothetical protein
MPFMMVCNNKGCGKHQSPTLSVEDNKVYCAECDKEITNVNPFIKNQMKSMNQIKKENNKSFGIKCNNCGKEGRPKKDNNNLICSFCSKELSQLSPIYKSMLIKMLGNIDKEL